ncbi:hypothetical protein DQ04_05501040 [Trypanosoma grayi]|uniref:hypothetical protein n=1 Tax=Trypanosoma grayi TaxID=71804 RepID=UPI0004F48DEF|nr:hypothetical protein DQ04_05501040 [Trypanosoma grayi]KEG09274.1 hypothetical protein DQ04_05501040 [Trypanosoma grayi]
MVLQFTTPLQQQRFLGEEIALLDTPRFKFLSEFFLLRFLLLLRLFNLFGVYVVGAQFFSTRLLPQAFGLVNALDELSFGGAEVVVGGHLLFHKHLNVTLGATKGPFQPTHVPLMVLHVLNVVNKRHPRTHLTKEGAYGRLQNRRRR